MLARSGQVEAILQVGHSKRVTTNSVTSRCLLVATLLVLLPVVPARAATPVVVGHAGMLADLVQKGLTPEVAPGVELKSFSGGSLKVARDIRDGALAADIFGSADATANRLLMGEAGQSK